MDSLTTTLRAVADPTRRTILDLLRTGGRSVTDLSQQFSMSRPAVSKHLAILRDAGLVAARREGRKQIYELDAGLLGEAREWLEGHRQGGERQVASPAPAKRPRCQPPRRRAAGNDDWRSW